MNELYNKPIIIIIDSGVSNELVIDKTEIAEKITISKKGIVWGRAVDEHGHGTALAGMLNDFCGEYIELIIIKILDENCRSTSVQLVQALELAISLNPDIINMSLGTEDLTYIEDIKRLCNLAISSDILLTTTSSRNHRNTLPYIIDGTIKVLAHSQLITDKILYTDYKNKFYTLGSPHIVPWKNGRYVFINQNSFSTPYFIREFVFDKKKGGNKTNYDVYNSLLNKCEKMEQLGDKGIIQMESPHNSKIFNEILKIVKRRIIDFSDTRISFRQGVDMEFCIELIRVLKKELNYKIPISNFSISDFEYISNLSNKIDSLLVNTE